MEALAAAKMKATTTVTLFIITVLVAVGWSTVEVNASEAERADNSVEDKKLADLEDLEEKQADLATDICYRYLGTTNNSYLGCYMEWFEEQKQKQKKKQEQCCVLFHKRQPPRKMGDIWIAVGLSTVFLFFMVLILQVFRNLEGQRKSCRKAHPVPIDDAGGLTNLLG